jgi:hypothetical protein
MFHAVLSGRKKMPCKHWVLFNPVYALCSMQTYSRKKKNLRLFAIGTTAISHSIFCPQEYFICNKSHRWIKTKLTPWNRVLLQKPVIAQLVKKFSVLHGTLRLTMFTRARHWSLSRASPQPPIIFLLGPF